MGNIHPPGVRFSNTFLIMPLKSLKHVNISLQWMYSKGWSKTQSSSLSSRTNVQLGGSRIFVWIRLKSVPMLIMVCFQHRKFHQRLRSLTAGVFGSEPYTTLTLSWLGAFSQTVWPRCPYLSQYRGRWQVLRLGLEKAFHPA